MADKYIDKVKKDGQEYDIHASNGGTKLYKHYVSYRGYSIQWVGTSSIPNDAQESDTNTIIGDIKFSEAGDGFIVDGAHIKRADNIALYQATHTMYIGNPILTKFDESLGVNILIMKIGAVGISDEYLVDGTDTVTEL